MKTAMQELIEYIESNEIVYNKDLILKLKELLEKEKEQIISAVNYGNKEDFYDATEFELSNYYYNQTYKQTNGIEVDANKSQVTTTGVWSPKTN